jgi:hypothetical protein
LEWNPPVKTSAGAVTTDPNNTPLNGDQGFSDTEESSPIASPCADRAIRRRVATTGHNKLDNDSIESKSSISELGSSGRNSPCEESECSLPHLCYPLPTLS